MAKTLAIYDIENPYLEAELLLRHLLHMERAQFYVNLIRDITPEQSRALSILLQRRIHREPLAYITGAKEFFGIEFYVDGRVLIPRPETELLVEQALEIANSRFHSPCVIADIGTGCGVIAIALALNLPQAEVYATDVSEQALEVAAINCHRYKVSERVHLLRGDLLAPLTQPIDLIVANVPYVKDSDIAELGAESRLFEPLSALAGGEDGLHWIRRLLPQAKGKLHRGGAMLLEIAPEQGAAVVDRARRLYPEAELRVSWDLSGHERAVIIQGL
jgi:release factor glutamine methyltransferase